MTIGADHHTHGPRKVIGSKQIERLGPGDLTELVSDAGPVPLHVGAVLFLAETDIDTPDPATVRSVLAERLVRIQRLRQHLIEPGCGLGRPYWFDDAHFDLEAHLSQVRCPAPGDRETVLSLAVDALTRPLPRTRPLWRAIVVIHGLSRIGWCPQPMCQPGKRRTCCHSCCHRAIRCLFITQWSPNRTSAHPTVPRTRTATAVPSAAIAFSVPVRGAGL